MKYWNELKGSELMQRVFSAPVDINQCKLYSTTINDYNGEILLAFDIFELPDRPPIKWIARRFNTCRVGLSFGNIIDFNLKYTPPSKNFDVTITKEDSYLVVMKNEKNNIYIQSEFLRILGPGVYLNDTEENI